MVSVYQFGHGTNWLQFIEEKFLENCQKKCYEGDNGTDEKLEKALNVTKTFQKSVSTASQEYLEFITDITSAQGKFYLQDTPKLVKYSTVVNRIAFLSRMFLQSHE